MLHGDAIYGCWLERIVILELFGVHTAGNTGAIFHCEHTRHPYVPDHPIYYTELMGFLEEGRIGSSNGGGAASAGTAVQADGQ